MPDGLELFQIERYAEKWRSNFLSEVLFGVSSTYRIRVALEAPLINVDDVRTTLQRIDATLRAQIVRSYEQLDDRRVSAIIQWWQAQRHQVLERMAEERPLPLLEPQVAVATRHRDLFVIRTHPRDDAHCAGEPDVVDSIHFAIAHEVGEFLATGGHMTPTQGDITMDWEREWDANRAAARILLMHLLTQQGLHRARAYYLTHKTDLFDLYWGVVGYSNPLASMEEARAVFDEAWDYVTQEKKGNVFRDCPKVFPEAYSCAAVNGAFPLKCATDECIPEMPGSCQGVVDTGMSPFNA